MVRKRKKAGTMNNDEQPQGYVAPELQEASATNDAAPVEATPVVAEVVTQQDGNDVEVINQVNTPAEEAEAQAANEEQSRDRFASMRGKSDEELAAEGVPAPSRPRNHFPQPDVDPLAELNRYRAGLATEGEDDDEVIG